MPDEEEDDDDADCCIAVTAFVLLVDLAAAIDTPLFQNMLYLV